MGKKKGGGAVRLRQIGPKGGTAAGHGDVTNPMAEFMQSMSGGAGGAGSGMPGLSAEEMTALLPPPPLNRAYQVHWPVAESFTMKTGAFQVIYPNYLDAGKDIKHGRRLAAAQCVAAPTVADVAQALRLLRVRHVVQPYRGYPPDFDTVYHNPGRCLVQVKRNSSSSHDDGSKDGPGGRYTKRELLPLIASRMADLPERRLRLGRQQQAEEEEAERTQRAAAAAVEPAVAAPPKKQLALAAAAAAAAATAAGAAAAGGSTSRKKKGRKRK